ncbi:hypothetical protein FKP32DRAFT_1614688 [Trametes sanguinea]|nr:hypothetical protein FKP32DRAFT_1614688 [Trametes sanguinea]
MPIATEVSPAGTTDNHLRHISTQDLHRGSPTPRFEVEKPRGRSLSPVQSRAAETRPTNTAATSSNNANASTSSEPYVAPPLTWRTAAQDAKAGIHYTKDDFPSSSFLPPPFSREPVEVQAAERVELLDEVDEYAVRVRVLRTGKVGLIPAWNIEGALDRLTRINTAFNEAATCPVEAHSLRRRFSESSAMHTSTKADRQAAAPPVQPITHVHSRCIPFAARVRYGDYYANPSAYDDSSSDSDDPESPQSPPDQEPGRGRTLHSQPAIFHAPQRALETEGGIERSQESTGRSGSGGRKSVVFPEEERPQVVYRYPSEDLVGAFMGEYQEKQESSSTCGEEDEDGDEWWWHGWEEPLEELEAEYLQEEHEEEERGRPRGEKMVGVEDEEPIPMWLAAIQEESY